jgi:hypothetical protein
MGSGNGGRSRTTNPLDVWRLTLLAVSSLLFLCGTSGRSGTAHQKVVRRKRAMTTPSTSSSRARGGALQLQRQKAAGSRLQYEIGHTAAAAKYLGPRFEYKTSVGLCATLVVIGSGDPLLGDQETDDRYGRAAGWIVEKIARPGEPGRARDR